MTEIIEFMGAPASPYTRKMLALLRYRRIAHRVSWGGFNFADANNHRPQPKVKLLPTFYLPNANGEIEAVTDSSPILRRLEKSHQGRAVLPDNGALSFINDLIEDYADEWLTKSMFHYRWHYAPDIEKAAKILPRYHMMTETDATIDPLSKMIGERQISRLSYVGSNAVTKQTIEESFERFLALMDAHLQVAGYMLGNRPASADFAIYGQLTQLALFDPTPQKLIIDKFARIAAWVEIMEDLSGLECDAAGWFDTHDLPDTLTAFLGEFARLYLPYLHANAAAVMKGDAIMEAELDGRAWSQNPFAYQAKCLGWLREDFAKLSEADRALLVEAASGTNLIEQLS